MKDPVKVLFVAQELTPYVPENLMAKVCRELPQYIQEQGCEIRIFMPCYGLINERRNQLHEVQRLSGMNLIIDDSDHPLVIKVASLPSARMQVYFIDNDDFFRRRGTVVDANGEEYDDNGDRMLFFARGVLETIKKLRWTPDIIHCHGWMTSLIPMFIRTAYRDDPFFEQSKIVYTAYNNPFQKTFDATLAKRVMTKGVLASDIQLITGDKIGFEDITRVAIQYSEKVDAGAAEVNDLITRLATEQNKPFELFEEDFKAKYMRMYADVDSAFAEE